MHLKKTVKKKNILIIENNVRSLKVRLGIFYIKNLSIMVCTLITYPVIQEENSRKKNFVCKHLWTQPGALHNGGKTKKKKKKRNHTHLHTFACKRGLPIENSDRLHLQWRDSGKETVDVEQSEKDGHKHYAKSESNIHAQPLPRENIQTHAHTQTRIVDFSLPPVIQWAEKLVVRDFLQHSWKI